jgi:hypothetical protein
MYKYLQPEKIKQIEKSLLLLKNRRIEKSFRLLKNRRTIESLRALKSPRLVKNPCLSAESPAADFSLVWLMSSRSDPRRCDEYRM